MTSSLFGRSGSLSPSRKVEYHQNKALMVGAELEKRASTELPIAQPQSAEARQQIVTYLSSPQSKLFSEVTGYFPVSNDHLDQLIACGKSLHNTLLRLNKLDAKGKRFKTMEALIESINASELRAHNKKRKQIIAFFGSHNCKLFAHVDSVQVGVGELDSLLAASDTPGASTGSHVRSLFRMMTHLSELGQRFDSVRSLVPVISLMHEKEQQQRQHEAMHVQLAAQQNQLLLLQSHFNLSQQVHVPALPVVTQIPPQVVSSSTTPDLSFGDAFIQQFLNQSVVAQHPNVKPTVSLQPTSGFQGLGPNQSPATSAIAFNMLSSTQQHIPGTSSLSCASHKRR